MSKRTTQLKLHSSDFQKLENLIQEKSGEQYKIKAFHYADMIMMEIKENRFKHTLHLNKSKDSRIVTKRKLTHPNVMIPFIVIIGIYYQILEPNVPNGWDLLFSLLLVVVLTFLPSIMEKIFSSFKKEIEEKHEQMKDLILSINNSTF